MHKNKNSMGNIIAIITVVIILGGVAFGVYQTGLFEKSEPPAKGDGIIYFYGDGCPHCKNVADFIAQNKIEEKVNFTKVEVWDNQENRKTFAEVALSKCGYASNQIGVPFIYDGANRCYMGDIDVIDFFKNAAGIQ